MYELGVLVGEGPRAPSKSFSALYDAWVNLK